MLNYSIIINYTIMKSIQMVMDYIKAINALNSFSMTKLHGFVTESKKSGFEPVGLPVPGMQCPNCLKKGQTVWVIPGKNCPKCGTPCGKVMTELGPITFICGVASMLIGLGVLGFNLADLSFNGVLTLGNGGELNINSLFFNDTNNVKNLIFAVSVLMVTIFYCIYLIKLNGSSQPKHYYVNNKTIKHTCNIKNKKHLRHYHSSSIGLNNKISKLPNFVTEPKNSGFESVGLPVPGVQCPNCLKKGQTVWVIPGKNCPKCGTPCGKYRNVVTIIVIACIIISVAVAIAVIDFNLSEYLTTVFSGDGSVDNIKNKSKDTIDPLDRLRSIYINKFIYFAVLNTEESELYLHTANLTENAQNSKESAESLESVQHAGYDETTQNLESTESSTETINKKGSELDPSNMSELNSAKTSESDENAKDNQGQSEIVQGVLCKSCFEQGCYVYTMPGQQCSEEGHVSKDEAGYDSDLAEDMICWHCLQNGVESSVYPGQNCSNCGTICKTPSESTDKNQTNSPLIQFVIIKQITLILLSSLILSFTNMGVYVVLSGLFILTLFALCNNNEKLISNKTNSNQESVFTTIYNIVINQIDEFRGQWYFPFLYAIFVFIVINNLIGMVPYSFSTTAHFILTFFLSIVVVLGSTILGIFIHIFKFFSLLVPENCPLLLLALLVFIETISYIARNISLGLRLAANVLSGHMLLNILSGFTYKISKKGFLYLLVDIIPMSFITAFSALEIGIAFIQAQVFSVLSGSYIKDGLNLH